MNFIKKKDKRKYILKIKVKPNSKKQEILKVNKGDDYITIKIQSQPAQNKANKELLNLLKNKLQISSNQIFLISGAKTPDKYIQLSFDKEIAEQEILNKLYN